MFRKTVSIISVCLAFALASSSIWFFLKTSDLEYRIGDLERTNERLTEDLSELYDTVDVLNASLVELESQIGDLERTNERLTEDLSELYDTVDVLNASLVELESQLSAIEEGLTVVHIVALQDESPFLNIRFYCIDMIKLNDEDKVRLRFEIANERYPSSAYDCNYVIRWRHHPYLPKYTDIDLKMGFTISGTYRFFEVIFDAPSVAGLWVVDIKIWGGGA